MPQQSDRCPLCHQPNRCAVASGAKGEAPCWCMAQPFPDASNPSAAAALSGQLGSACLCQACIQRLAALG